MSTVGLQFIFNSTYGCIRQIVFSSEVLFLEEADNRKLVIVGVLWLGPS